MLRPPPSSTLFPTRRSSDLGAHLAQARSGYLGNARPASAFHLFQSHGLGRLRPHDKERGNFRTDRKSTRLNSSHSSISYAVFCLKKKKRDVHDCAECTIPYE